MAASTRVGNLIGAKSAKEARNAAHASALLSVMVGGIVLMLLMVAKDVSALPLFPYAYLSNGVLLGMRICHE